MISVPTMMDSRSKDYSCKDCCVILLLGQPATRLQIVHTCWQIAPRLNSTPCKSSNQQNMEKIILCLFTQIRLPWFPSLQTQFSKKCSKTKTGGILLRTRESISAQITKLPMSAKSTVQPTVWPHRKCGSFWSGITWHRVASSTPTLFFVIGGTPCTCCALSAGRWGICGCVLQLGCFNSVSPCILTVLLLKWSLLCDVRCESA